MPVLAARIATVAGRPHPSPLACTVASLYRRPATGCTHGGASCGRHYSSVPIKAQVGEGTQEVVVGIDLGTTNSAIAVIEDGRPVIVPNAHGDKTTPSVVAFSDSGVLVGSAARKQAASNPRNTFFSVKRLVGRALEDVRELARGVPYEVGADEDGFAVLRCEHAEGGSLYPEEVSAHVLASLLADAEVHTGRVATRGVISVPAYFDEAQREATVTAGRIAGLQTVKIIREPVAAALAYGVDVQRDQSILVFDLGGGTFDVSILEVGGGVVEVLATGGDMSLGGDDWDAAIVGWLEEGYLRPAGVDTSDPGLRSRLRGIAEAAKMALSARSEVVIRMPVGGQDGRGCEAVLTAAQLDKLSTPLFKRARFPIEEACLQAGIDLGTAARTGDKGKKRGKRGAKAGQRPKRRLPITTVLLVGGATRLPGVHPFLRNMTGLEPDVNEAVDPDLAVAAGAALQAGMLEGSVKDMMVLDVWQAALMRAFAQKQLASDRQTAEQYLSKEDLEDFGEWLDDDEDGDIVEDEEDEAPLRSST